MHFEAVALFIGVFLGWIKKSGTFKAFVMDLVYRETASIQVQPISNIQPYLYIVFRPVVYMIYWCMCIYDSITFI